MQTLSGVAAELLETVAHTRVFLSMPYIAGLTPVCMERAGIHSFMDEVAGLERRDGIFALNEAGLSPLDHGNLYGDAVFEGIRVDNRRIVAFKEHVDRWLASAHRIGLEFPYSREELCRIIVDLCREAMGDDARGAYLRPVLTRGIGNLGVSPFGTVAPSVYIVCSAVLLYPASMYAHGIAMQVARRIRRNDRRQLDPNIKTNNYLNNVQALLETRGSGALEALMLTNEGYVAEATADNIFVAQQVDGVPVLKVPASRYALVGLTRAFVMDTARRLGFTVIEDDAMLVSDFIGTDREVFMTGTACGIMPVSSIDGHLTAPEGSRPLMDRICGEMSRRVSDPGISFGIDGDDLASYLVQPPCFG